MANTLRNYLWLLKPGVTAHIATNGGKGWMYAGTVTNLIEKIPGYLLERGVEETFLEAHVGLVIIIDGEEDGVL